MSKKQIKFKLGIFIAIFLSFSAVYLGYKNITGPDKWVFISKIPSPIRKAGQIVIRTVKDIPYIHYYFVASDLPVYNIVIGQEDLNWLNSNLPEDTETLSAIDNEPVPALFIYNNEEYKVEVRYRGDTKNHWLWPKKSWRVIFEKDELFEGKSEINLIVPIDRKYLVEQLLHERARRLGLITFRSKFVILTINGRNPAIYWLVEHFREEFLEINTLSSDGNLYGENDVEGQLYKEIESWKKYNSDIRFNENNFSEISLLLDLLNNASDEEFYKLIFDILDEESFYNWSIHSILSFSTHQDSLHNLRLYFDPSIGKFKIIPWDVGLQDARKWADDISPVLKQSYNFLAQRILENSEFMNKRNELLWQIVQTDAWLNEELRYYDELYEQVKVAFYKDKIRRYSNSFFDKEVKENRESLQVNYRAIQKFLGEIYIEN